jgi:hypothetical protein
VFAAHRDQDRVHAVLDCLLRPRGILVCVRERDGRQPVQRIGLRLIVRIGDFNYSCWVHDIS